MDAGLPGLISRARSGTTPSAEHQSRRPRKNRQCRAFGHDRARSGRNRDDDGVERPLSAHAVRRRPRHRVQRAPPPRRSVTFPPRPTAAGSQDAGPARCACAPPAPWRRPRRIAPRHRNAAACGLGAKNGGAVRPSQPVGLRALRSRRWWRRSGAVTLCRADAPASTVP